MLGELKKPNNTKYNQTLPNQTKPVTQGDKALVKTEQAHYIKQTKASKQKSQTSHSGE